MNLDTDSLTALGLALQFFALAGTLLAFYHQLKAQRLELHESTKVQLSQGYYNAILLGQRPLEMLIEDDNLARIATIGYATPETLSEVEWARFGNFMFLQFNAWELFYYQHGDGQIRKELWVGAENYYRWLIETKPGLSRFGRSGTSPTTNHSVPTSPRSLPRSQLPSLLEGRPPFTERNISCRAGGLAPSPTRQFDPRSAVARRVSSSRTPGRP